MTVSDKQGNKIHVNILITEVFLRQAKRQKETDWRQGVVTKNRPFTTEQIVIKPFLMKKSRNLSHICSVILKPSLHK